jgi:sterol desaturase/sphingolipid hydroxylase (fatty acid hydroxylase superfamily)
MLLNPQVSFESDCHNLLIQLIQTLRGISNMPTPLEILLDPISIVLFTIYAVLIILEWLFPGRTQPSVKGWITRSMIAFTCYFYLSTYLPLLWDQYLTPYQLFDLSQSNIYLSTFVAVMVFELLIYVWHRSMHKNNQLWLIFHQMHHSAERHDSLGAFYFSPMDMIGFTMVGSLALALIVGLAPQAISWFLYITMFLAVFQHANIRTPQWLGYIIQRPESHSVHHEKGLHAYNYSDLPIFDILFGTFRNPKEFRKDVGFYHGASSRIPEMLIFRDVSKEPKENSAEQVVS